MAPHVHSIVVVHPDLAGRFLEVAGELEAVWKGIPRRTGDPVRLALRSGSPIGRPVYDNGSLRADLEFPESGGLPPPATGRPSGRWFGAGSTTPPS